MIRVGFFIDLAVAVADGATTISDIAVLGDQVELCGPVASDSTCWRLLDRLDSTALDHIAQARAGAREVVWAQRAQPLDKPFSSATAAGREIPGLGCTRQFLAHVRGLPENRVSCCSSVGWAITERERVAIAALPTTVWADAIDTHGRHRDGAA
jgi:hypothetical protein